MRRAVRRPGLARDHRAHQLVGVQAALHQRLGLAFAHELDRLRGRRVAVRRVDDLDSLEMSMPCCFATASMLAPAGRPGSARSARACAASTAPRERALVARDARPPSRTGGSALASVDAGAGTSRGSCGFRQLLFRARCRARAGPRDAAGTRSSCWGVSSPRARHDRPGDVEALRGGGCVSGTSFGSAAIARSSSSASDERLPLHRRLQRRERRRRSRASAPRSCAGPC